MKAANGWPWAGLALALLLFTILFGTGPEGSGVKVNLFGFQPSELVKFLLLLFLAGFFATNEKFISEYRSWRKRWSFFSAALLAIVTAILLFLILGDLGPRNGCLFYVYCTLFIFTRRFFIYDWCCGSVCAGGMVHSQTSGWQQPLPLRYCCSPCSFYVSRQVNPPSWPLCSSPVFYCLTRCLF